MSERDEFLRDRVRPDRPDTPAARPSGPQSRDNQAAPLRAFSPSAPSRPPFVPAPLPPQPHPPSAPQPSASPPRPSAPPQHPPATPPSPQRPQPDSPRPPVAEPEHTPAAQIHDRGWRRILRLATFGLVKSGPSAAQRRQSECEATIRTVLHGTHKVGVLGKGGVGKTSVAASVGSIFAELRQQDRVVAIDADTGFGRLSSRIDPRATGSFWELTADKNLQSFADMTARVGRNSAGLYVLGGEQASGSRRVLDAAVYREAALRLDRHFTISVIDCGATMDSPVNQEVLRDLDALIVVSSPWADGASVAAKTMDWLSDHGLTGLLRRSVVVLNDSDGHADKRTRSLLAREFVDRGQPVVEVPYDSHLRPGGVIDVSHEMARRTRLRFLDVAATIVGYFASEADER